LRGLITVTCAHSIQQRAQMQLNHGKYKMLIIIYINVTNIPQFRSDN